MRNQSPGPLRAYRHRLMTALRHNGIAWRYGLNAAPALSYATSPGALSPGASRALRDLNRDGVAITSVEALGIDQTLYAAMAAEVDRLELQKAGELDEARRMANDTTRIGQKTFNIELLGSRPFLDHQHAFCRFALDQALLGVANAYFNMLTRLRYFNVWHTLATNVAPRESQLWHRDREDFLILKAFVYLADVGMEAGPFTYAPGTHPKGPIRQSPEYTLEGRVQRSTDQQMAAVVPPERWIQGLGPRGTVVLADTQGLHKGGLARGCDRIMYTCMFTSRASDSPELFQRTAPAPEMSDKARTFALR
jgi:hypothetical protein